MVVVADSGWVNGNSMSFIIARPSSFDLICKRVGFLAGFIADCRWLNGNETSSIFARPSSFEPIVKSSDFGLVLLVIPGDLMEMRQVSFLVDLLVLSFLYTDWMCGWYCWWLHGKRYVIVNRYEYLVSVSSDWDGMTATLAIWTNCKKSELLICSVVECQWLKQKQNDSHSC